MEGESGSSGSAGETMPRAPLPTFPSVVIQANLQKSRGATCRRDPESREDRIPRATNVWAVITADYKTKFSMKNESQLHHRYAVIVQGLASQWTRFFPPESKPGVICNDNACEILSWNLNHIDPKHMESPNQRSEE